LERRAHFIGSIWRSAWLLLLALPMHAATQTSEPAPPKNHVGLFSNEINVSINKNSKIQDQSPCMAKRNAIAFAQAAVAGAVSPDPDHPPLDPALQPAPCPPLAPLIDWYARFLNGPDVKPLTPKEKAHLALRNLFNPFNFATIGIDSGFSVAIDSHSPYGPGMRGFGRNVGVSFTQDMTGEFFGTFLIPSLVHQDPHYHRMPHATVQRRIAHCIYDVAWTQGDNGHGMLNYGDLAGFAIDDQIGNLYVPGQSTTASSTATRYVTGLAAAPIDNFIIEFLPSIASHFHTRIVFVQRIINQVARTGTTTQ
jgi:hypothetical protein